MSQHTIETVIFKLNKGESADGFAKAAEAITEFAERQKGFITRRLSRGEDGLWIDHIEWETLADAQAAAAKIGQEASLGPCMKAIDETSVVMHHTSLEISVN
ncbi:hypothetical protein [Planktotalea sp.]|uniref:hypothetical protein n=1 Tax=Planktotalea sp. TaxID=2029877 RepID=UPI003298C361